MTRLSHPTTTHLDTSAASTRTGPARLAWPSVGVLPLMMLVALYLALTQNLAFLRALESSLPQPFGWQEWRLAATVFVALTTLLLLVMLPFGQRRTLKPALIFLLLVAAVCSYFMDTFGTVIDRSMLVNVANTDRAEAGDLLQSAFFAHLLLHGAMPAWLVARCPVRHAPMTKSLLQRLAFALMLIASLGSLVFVQYNDVVFWGRLHRDVRLFVNPTYPIYSAIRFAKDAIPTSPQAPLIPLAADASRTPRSTGRPLLVVLVLGETARAANFQLNGYGRPTNPRLSQVKKLINFPQVRSCGTATAESVPCLFSGLGHEDFSRDRARAQENLLDVFKRVGVDVTWRDNDSGCQGVCIRTGMESLERAGNPDLCAAGECFDGILLQDLEKYFPQPGATRFLVLHQKGSHGPAYFKRYPLTARRFTPDCRNENVQRCSREEVINSYDNSLVYTDEILASLIDILKARQDEMDSVMLYVSDHGESLGENGIYLHGLPYRLAPRDQTWIPMMAWFSAQASESLDIDTACLRETSTRAYSHDNLFPSLLGLLDVSTSAYDASGDIFAACRRRN